MSTVLPPPLPPAPPRTPEHRRFIDDQIDRTRRALQWTDAAVGAVALATSLLLYLLVAAVLDQWVFRGGMGPAARVAMFALLVTGFAWFMWRTLAPLFRAINPAYAAQTIERHSPTLKNSLLNLLMLRKEGRAAPPKVYEAIEQQAAQRLALTDVDEAVDKSAALRQGYILVGVVAIFAAYAVLSPKNIITSASRVLLPLADIAAPSRVQITEVKPGDGAAARGETTTIAATITGATPEDELALHYRALEPGAKRAAAEQVLAMRAVGAVGVGGQRIECLVPAPGGRSAALGLQTPIEYWIEAGDARSRKFRLSLFSRPTIVVQRVQYEPPAYTGLPTSEALNTGDVEGLEGTRVTIAAQANRPIKAAHIDFDADGTRDIAMQLAGDRATGVFTLALADDGRSPRHESYVLRFTDEDGRTNEDPAKYRIAVTADYAPEVRITQPVEEETTVALSDVAAIAVDARDPDFALAAVRIDGNVDGRTLTLGTLLSARQEGRLQQTLRFRPADAHLQPGQVVEYWAVAEDNKRPHANVSLSNRKRLRVAAPNQPGGGAPQPGEGQGDAGDDQQPKKSDAADNQGAGGANKPSDGGAGNGAQNKQDSDNQDGEKNDQPNQSQPGQNGEQGDQAQPGDKGEQKNDQSGQGEQGPGLPGAGGQGQGENSQGDQQQPGAPGGQSDPNAQSNQDDAAGGNAAQPNQPSQQNGPGEQGGNASDKNSADNNPGDGQQPGAAGAGQPSGNGSSEPVANNGDDDATAFDRIAEHLGVKNETQDNSQQGDAGQNAAKQDQANPSGDPTAQPQDNSVGGGGNDAQSQQAGEQEQPAGDNQNAGQQGAQANPSNESSNPSGDPTAQPQDNSVGGAGNDAQSQPSNQSQQPGGSDQQKQAQSGDQQSAQENPGEGRNGSDEGADANSGVDNPHDGAGGSGSQGEDPKATPDGGQPPQGRQKTDRDQRGEQRKNDEAASGGQSKKESDSKGDQAGDQSGGGAAGAGQRANSEGQGTPGENTAADEGAGAGQEQGQGETGKGPGDQQLAPGKTGQSSGDQPGQGSKSRESGEAQPPQPTDDQNVGDGDNAAQPGQPGPSAQDNQADQQSEGGQQGQDGQPGAPSGGGGAAGPSGGNGSGKSQGDQGPESKRPDPSKSASNAPPSGGAPSGDGGASGAGGFGGSHEAVETPTSDPNLEFARQQTDLVLEKLDEQLAKRNVDPQLLKKLGWSADDLRKFVDRWKSLRDRAASDGANGDEAKAELDDALRALGLHRAGPQRLTADEQADDVESADAFRERAPREYQDRVRAYVRSAAASDDQP